jgi:hypothetical protein
MYFLLLFYYFLLFICIFQQRQAQIYTFGFGEGVHFFFRKNTIIIVLHNIIDKEKN